MDLSEILDQRWSCRAFLDEEVPEHELREVFALAQRSASWCNTQSWQVHLVSGELKARLSKELVESVISGAGGSDLPLPERYEGVYQERRRDSGFALYETLGIAREDQRARAEQMLKNFTFFGAPHVAIVTTDATQGVYGAVDSGGYVANLLNIAHMQGLGTCPQAAIAMQSPVVREVLDLPADRLVVCAVAIGRPDLAAKVNTFRTSRADVDDAVVFIS